MRPFEIKQEYYESTGKVKGIFYSTPDKTLGVLSESKINDIIEYEKENLHCEKNTIYYFDDKVIIVCETQYCYLIFFKNGIVHRDNDQPAICSFGGTVIKTWYEKGFIKRSTGNYTNLSLTSQMKVVHWFNVNEAYHREDGAAQLVDYKNIVTHEYFLHNNSYKKHNYFLSML